MGQIVFNGNVIHNKEKFVKHQSVPKHLIEEMTKQGLTLELPDPAQPVEPPKSLGGPRDQRKPAEK